MKYKFLPLLALFALVISSCEKEEVNAKVEGKEALMTNEWKYQDIVVDQDISYTFMGSTVDYANNFSAIEGMASCELDFTIHFLADDKFDYSLLDSFCGDDFSQSTDALWSLNDDNTEFTLRGSGVAGMFSTDGVNFTSLGDEVVYQVIELTDKSFIYEYNMDQAAIMESMDLSDLPEGFEMEFSGSSIIRVSLESL